MAPFNFRPLSSVVSSAFSALFYYIIAALRGFCLLGCFVLFSITLMFVSSVRHSSQITFHKSLLLCQHLVAIILLLSLFFFSFIPLFLPVMLILCCFSFVKSFLMSATRSFEQFLLTLGISQQSNPIDDQLFRWDFLN